METKHTPGPWHINEHTSGPAFDATRVYIDSGLIQVAIAERRADSLEQWANARLIAAAPELLEALKLFTSVMHSKVTGETEDDALFQGERAIAKALGR